MVCHDEDNVLLLLLVDDNDGDDNDGERRIKIRMSRGTDRIYALLLSPPPSQPSGQQQALWSDKLAAFHFTRTMLKGTARLLKHGGKTPYLTLTGWIQLSG